MSISSNDTITEEIDLTQSSLHWITDDAQNDNALPISGSASYILLGNTDPTNNSGDVGVLGDASFFVDFTNQTVANSLLLSVGGSVWSASGTGSIIDGSHWFEGLYSQVLVDGVSGGAGEFAGFFSSMIDSGTGLPAGAGVVYSLVDSPSNPSTIVNGTLIFGLPHSQIEP